MMSAPTPTATAAAPTPSQRVFLTGGSGFLGQRILARLLHNGHTVSALACSDSTATQLRGAGATVVSGDMQACDALDLSQVDAVWRLLGLWHWAPPLTAFDVAFMSQPRRYNIDATVRELGYVPEPFAPGTSVQ